MSEYYKKEILPVRTKKARTAYFFDKLSDAQKFADDVLGSVSSTSPARRFYRPLLEAKTAKQIAEFGTDAPLIDWFGTNSSDWVGKPINTYVFSSILDSELDKFRQNVSKINIEDLQQVKRIEFTEKEIGIFSFDLASLGLIRVFEYYSPLLKKVVSGNDVFSVKSKEGDLVFYYKGNPYIPKHQVFFDTKRGAYYSKILGRVVEKSELVEYIPEDPNLPIELFYPEVQEVEKHQVERVQKTDEFGNKKFTTTFKKSFIYIPKVKKKKPRIDFIVPIAYSAGITAKEMFWNSILICSLAVVLTQANIEYRIIGSRSIYPIRARNEREIFNFINLKTDQENIDPNAISIVVGDARFYRYELFKLSFASQIDSGSENYVGDGISYPISDQDTIKQGYIDYLSQQTNESDREAAKRLDTKIFLPRVLNEQDALQEYETVINQIRAL